MGLIFGVFGDLRKGWRVMIRRGGATKPRILVFAVGIGALAGCAWSRGAPPELSTGPGLAARASLAPRLDALLDEAPFDGASWGVLVVELGGRPLSDGASEPVARGVPDAPPEPRVLYARNPGARLIPASNMKTVVTAAALGILGPEFRWRTELYSQVIPVDGTLDGDLVLRGTGDPTLGRPFFDPPELAFFALADSLAAAGVERVTGSLVIDASAWDSTSVPGSWMVEDLAPALGATGGPFAFSGGELAVTVVGGAAPGDTARVWWEPLRAMPLVRSSVVTVADRADASLLAGFLPESRLWEVYGTVGAGDSTTIRFSMRDPVRIGAGALAAAISATGIEIEGGLQILWERVPSRGDASRAAPEYACAFVGGAACQPLLRIAGLASPPLGEVVAVVLGPSQNWMSEQVVRTLGALAGAKGSWPEGTRAVTDHLVNVVGVNAADVRVEDGSGLSVKNLLTPRALVSTFEHAWTAPWFEDFRSALPTPRQRGTTLETRLLELEKRAFVKSGTLTNVSSLAGYLFRDDGSAIAFAILANATNLPNSVVNARVDAIVREIAGATGVVSGG